MKDVANGIRLNTANGKTKTKCILNFEFAGLADDVEAHVLAHTPTVFSLGKRCMNLGYSFEWKARRNPILITPRGKRVELEVIDDVPYLPQAICWPRDSGNCPDHLFQALPGAMVSKGTGSGSEGSDGDTPRAGISSETHTDVVEISSDRVDKGVSYFVGPPRSMCKWADMTKRRICDLRSGALIEEIDIDHGSDTDYFRLLPGCEASPGLEMLRPRRDLKTTFTFKVNLNLRRTTPEAKPDPGAPIVSDSSAEESDGDDTLAKRDLKKEAKSLKHLMTHFPKN